MRVSAVSSASGVLCWLVLTAGREAQAQPVALGLAPPGVSIGGRETWVLRGRGLRAVDRVHVEGGGVAADVRDATDDTLRVDVRADAGATPGARLVWVEGPDGVSNPRVVRVDRLSQTPEREPNDRVEDATPLPPGSAGVGVLAAQDVDHYRVRGRAGERVTVEVEARRLGAAVAPVVTVFTAVGRALAQRRESPGVAGDCRFVFTVPADGDLVIQVRDNLYRGSDTAGYRLRVTGEPFATGLFPLGGPPGRLTVTASGGSLDAPRFQTVTLPDAPGAVVEVPPFDGVGGPVLAPGRLVVGDGPGADEPDELGTGVTANGRIDRPGEVDRYRVKGKAGEPLRVVVTASPLGSWLDSVLTVRDPDGRVVAENDDAPPPLGPRRAAPEDPDSALTFTPESDATFTVELTDRFNDGGPAYAYRLSAGPPRPGLAIGVRLGPPGALNLRPGSGLAVPFWVVLEGRTGPVTVRAEGLPPGVRADPVTVRRPRAGAVPALAEGALTLRADPAAAPALGWVRLMATSASLTREAVVSLAFDPPPGQPPGRPAVLRASRFPVKVVVGKSDRP